MTTRRAGQIRALIAVVAVPTVVIGLAGSPARAAFTGGLAGLTRAPYLTDLTTSSVQVSWATSTQNHGVVRYGPPGSCTANTVTSLPLGNPITVNGVTEYRNSVAVSGLAAGTTYCYRVYTDDTPAVDLLGANASPQFTTLEAVGSSTPFTFDVVGDWGDTTNSGVNDGTLNVNQAGVDAQIAASGARFVLSTGDIGYPGGTQTNYGDLNQAGVNVSAVFGPSYWAVPGQSIPLHGVTGNHGLNATFLSVWPQSASAAAAGGVYAMASYPSVDGVTAASYPTAYYAFSTGGARFYVLDASWGDSNVGTATGGACGSHCAMYQVDHDQHWTATSAEFQWLAADLAAHPGGVKFAAFHFPLRSDDASEPDDKYLQNLPGSSGTLEQLLHDNGVSLVFNGHAHIYQRNVAPPGGVTSYVTGGGGARSTTVSHCSTTDAYAIGWSYSKNKGNACGGAPVPSADAQVYHFLRVTVTGSTVTVAPTDSQGHTFDVRTYDFGADTVAPSAPGALAFTRSSSGSKVTLSWSAAGDNVGVSGYDLYRNGAYLATTTSTASSYADTTVAAKQGYTYQVYARDLAGNATAASITVPGKGGNDTTPPTAPTGLAATSTNPTTASLSWNASTDDNGVAGYAILRDGAPVATVNAPAVAWQDTGLTPGTAYTYQVVASDAAGNASPPGGPVTVTTQADTSPPTAPGTPTATGVTSTQVGLAWTTSTDDVGVVRYDVLRNGSVVATVAGTTWTDTTVAPGTVYSYAVRAYDAAGNSDTSSALGVTTPTSGSVFYDGFETGDLAQWTTVNGLVVNTSLVHTGTFACRETSSGTAAYAYRTLPASFTELWMQAWVYVSSRSTSANLFGFRTSGGGSIVNLYLDASGRVSLRNNAGGVTTNSSTVVAAGAWHRFVLHAVVNGTASSVDVSLDGTAVPGLSLTGQDLGTSAIARLQLGETTTGRTYDIALDDVTVAQQAL
jgi:chitodextrinase